MDYANNIRLAAAYDGARRYLVEAIVNKVPNYNSELLLSPYLSLPDNSQLPVSLEELYQRVLESAQNANMKSAVIGHSIGGVGKLESVLHSFNPRKVLDFYGHDTDSLLADIKDTLKPTGQILTEPLSIWPRYCHTILSAARFFIQFESGKDFYNWANSFYGDKRFIAALPLIMAEEIYGIGYSLACDFLKELGFINYGKPDVHICQIFSGLGLCHKTASPYEIQKIIVQMAEIKGVSPYNVDKVFWLIGSGDFYMHRDIGNNGKNGRMKKDFVEKMTNGSLDVS